MMETVVAAADDVGGAVSMEMSTNPPTQLFIGQCLPLPKMPRDPPASQADADRRLSFHARLMSESYLGAYRPPTPASFQPVHSS